MLPRISEVDDFIAALWRIHLAVKSEGYTQVSLPVCSRDLEYVLLKENKGSRPWPLPVRLHGPRGILQYSLSTGNKASRIQYHSFFVRRPRFQGLISSPVCFQRVSHPRCHLTIPGIFTGSTLFHRQRLISSGESPCLTILAFSRYL